MSIGVMQLTHLLSRKSKPGTKTTKEQEWNVPGPRHTSNPALPQTLPQAGALQFTEGGSFIINFTDPAQGCTWVCPLLWNATAPFLCIKHKWDLGKEEQKQDWKVPCILNGFWNALKSDINWFLWWNYKKPKVCVHRNIRSPNWTPIIPNYIAYSEHLVLQHGLWCIRII